MRYRLLLVAATIIWGSTFVIVKDTTDALAPAWILVIRFFPAALILAAAFFRKHGLFFKREYILRGAMLGAALFLGYYLQTVGIMDTTPGKNAFLTATYCVIVPFVAWAIIHRRPTIYNIAAAVLCIAGVGFVSNLGGLTLSFGDGMTLLCAIFYALHVVLVARFSQGRDVYVLTMWQFFFVGLFSLAPAFLFGPIPTSATFTPGLIVSLAYLAIGATALALLFQNVGQAHVAPASAALLLSLESVFGVLFSILLGAETLTVSIIIGFALIFLSIVVSEVCPALKARGRFKIAE